jgi:23S rRNA pseudouridine2605 synthase
MAELERVQKILAKAGIASRRKAEELITEGSVTINGKTAKLGDKAQFGKDAIKVNGKLLQTVEAKVYLAFYKPRAVISMLVDTESRPTIKDYLRKVEYRVFPIGRLDYNSEGLLILTNDGDFAEKMQKRDDIPRVYTVKVKGHVTEETVRRLQKGARIEHRMVRPHSVRLERELENKSQVQIVILGGGAVDLRALFEMKGLLVDKITRTAIGHLTLRGLAPGHYRFLKGPQVEALLEQPELGMKLLEREIEEEKPKGQRKFHEKKVRPEAAEGATPKPAGRPQSQQRPQPQKRAEVRPRAPREAAPNTRRNDAHRPSSKTRGGYGIVKPSRG